MTLHQMPPHDSPWASLPSHCPTCLSTHSPELVAQLFVRLGEVVVAALAGAGGVSGLAHGGSAAGEGARTCCWWGQVLRVPWRCGSRRRATLPAAAAALRLQLQPSCPAAAVARTGAACDLRMALWWQHRLQARPGPNAHSCRQVCGSAGRSVGLPLSVGCVSEVGSDCGRQGQQRPLEGASAWACVMMA